MHRRRYSEMQSKHQTPNEKRIIRAVDVLREKSQTLMMDFSEKSRVHDQRVSQRLEQIKNTFGNVFLNTGLELATKKHNYFQRYKNSVQTSVTRNAIQVLQDNYGSHEPPSNLMSPSHTSELRFKSPPQSRPSMTGGDEFMGLSPALALQERVKRKDREMETNSIAEMEHEIREQLALLEAAGREHVTSVLSSEMPRGKQIVITTAASIESPTPQDVSIDSPEPSSDLMKQIVSKVDDKAPLGSKRYRSVPKRALTNKEVRTESELNKQPSRQELVERAAAYNEQVKSKLHMKIQLKRGSVITHSKREENLQVADITRQLEHRRRAEEHSKKVQDIFQHAKEIREAHLRELGCSVDPSDDESRKNDLQPGDQSGSSHPREGKITKFLFNALRSRDNLNQEASDHQSVSTVDNLDIEMRIPAVKIESQHDDVSKGRTDTEPFVPDSNRVQFRQRERAGDFSPIQLQDLDSVMESKPLSPVRGIKASRKEASPPSNILEEFKRAKANNDLEMHLTVFTEQARRTRQLRFEQELDERLKRDVIAKIVGKRAAGDSDAFNRMSQSLRKTLQMGIREKFRTRKDRVGVKPGRNVASNSDIDELSKTSITFTKMFPNFKTGITPVREPNSTMGKTTIAELMKQKQGQQQLYRRKEFQKINERQRRFKELMTVAPGQKKNHVDSGTALRQAAGANESWSDHKRSDSLVQREESVQTLGEVLRDFPFMQEATGQTIQIYKASAPKKRKTPLSSTRVPIRPSFFSPLPGAEKNEEETKQEKQPDKGEDSPKDKPEMTEKEKEEAEKAAAAWAEFRLVKENAIRRDNQKKQEALQKFFEYLQSEGVISNINQVQEALDAKVLKKGLCDFSKISDPNFKQFAKHVAQRRQFYDMCKDANSPRAKEALRADPQYIFQEVCKQAHMPAPSLFQKIQNKMLHLKGYNLHETHCKALGESCKQFPDALNQMLLEDNGLRDKGLGLIMDGLQNLSQLRKFVCINNEFNKAALKGFSGIFTKPNMRLDELRLSNCRMLPGTTLGLIELLREKEVYMRKLSLVNANVNQESVEVLMAMVRSSKHLIELDISYNELKASEMRGVISALSMNRRLQYINLSWNRIKERKAIIRGAEPTELDLEEREIIDELGQLIKHNGKLLHLNLTQTALTKPMLMAIAGVMRRAKSLLALHLTGNPGVDDDLKKQMHEKVVARPMVVHQYIDSFNRENLGIKQRSEGPNQLKGGLKVRKFQVEKNRREDGRLGPFDMTDSRILAFDRVIGHKMDMPGSGQWRMMTEMADKCWVCNNYVYSVIVWSKQIGFLCANQVEVKADEMLIEKVIGLQQKMENKLQRGDLEAQGHIDGYDVELGREGSSPGVPVIQGAFTNWHPKKMFPVESFCLELDQNKPDLVPKMLVEERCRKKVKCYDDLNEKEREIYRELEIEYSKIYRKTWQRIMKAHSKYRNINFVNANHIRLPAGSTGDFSPARYNDDSDDDSNFTDQASLDSEQMDMMRPVDLPDGGAHCQSIGSLRTTEDAEATRLFIFPCLMRPGNQRYLVRYDQGHDSAAQVEMSEYFSHSHLAPFRSVDIPTKHKVYSKKEAEERKFDKSNSVFRDWREDTPERIKLCCDHDFLNWKLEKFIKVEEEQEKIRNIIKQHMGSLKAIHNYYASASNYPYCNESTYNEFLRKLNITNENLFKGIEFKSAQNKSVPGAQDNHLMRFQFLEIIVRISVQVNRDRPTPVSESESLQYFIETELLPNCADILDEWQGFRDQKLWTLDVNEMFKLNQQSIKTLMEHYYGPKIRILTQDNAIAVFCKDSDVLTEKEAAHCYGMSKMINLQCTKSTQFYRSFSNISEFMEMIARAGEIRAANDPDAHDLSQVEKIELVLDKILPIVGLETMLPEEGGDREESQSDEDY